MKKILGLDLGTNSIGWALVNEGENENEQSTIIKVGVRVNPLTVDEQTNFEKGKSITTNADRTLKRSGRRNLQRFKLRKENLIEILTTNGWISSDTILSENGNKTTFETYRLRAKAVTEEISLEEFARVLLMINSKRGYKSSRKAKSQDEGQLIDGMEVAKNLYENAITPGQFVLQILKAGKKYIPDFYRSDLHAEFDKVFDKQITYHPDFLNEELKEELRAKKRDAIWAICAKKFKENGFELVGTKRKGNTAEQKVENYVWRAKALTEKLELEEFVIVLQQINSQINSSSGYLGSISDRSKELYFNKQTVGQNLMAQLDANPHTKLKNQVFYRQDYLDEFEKLWSTQSVFHNQLTAELKEEIRDVVIFYQRKLKSQKGLISICEFENRQVEVEIEGKKKTKTVGMKVCPKSSPLFQEFKIWQVLNNIQVIDKSDTKHFLEQEEKELLYAELSIKDKISKTDALKLLYKNPKELDLNFKDIEGNRTQAALFKVYQRIIELSGHGEYDFSKLPASETLEIVRSIFSGLNYNTDILNFDSSLEGKAFENQALYQLWHLLYSFEGDDSISGNDKLVAKLTELYGFEKEYANMLANINFQDDYGSLSTKAMRKILPHLKEGFSYGGNSERPEEPSACEYAGYRHSKSSLTREELDNKVLKDKLEILPKNSLRNPVVEKILNQMINVVNASIEAYGKPDEIRIELARELKKSAKEREDATAAISKTTAEHEAHRVILRKEFGLTNVSRNDIIRYKLYKELEFTGYKTLYSGTYIPQEKLFSKEFDIEHIIPQSRLFDDSFSNKTLELRSINIEKGNDTAIDFILKKYNEDGNTAFLGRIGEMYKAGKLSKTKYNKLKMKGEDIPSDFINRDLRDTQYIAKKAKNILEELVKEVVSTTGSVTDRLREDWQLIDVMQELNWDKYEKQGLTEVIQNRDGHRIKRIKDWTKRNDHRHHAMDALTIAFTKRSHIQYLNNLNARSDKAGSIYGIEQKELYRDDKGKLRFRMPLENFRSDAKKHLENTLVSIKARNKVATININVSKKQNGVNKKIQLTPRGQLHLETVYGSIKQYVTKEEKVNASLTKEQIEKVAKKSYREALLARLAEFDNDPKKAFTGKNSLDKNPVFIDEARTTKVPEKIKTVTTETVYTIRKDISPDLKIEKVIDVNIRKILDGRLNEFGGDSKKAFTNLDENPIWLNKEKGIAIKRVTITGISNAVSLHEKRDKDGKLILDKDGNKQPIDFVNTGNNHHVAIYRLPVLDKVGLAVYDEENNQKYELQENVISFFEATTRVNQGLPIIDKEYRKSEGWQFLFSMKQNEYFVFPKIEKREKVNEETGEITEEEIITFNPKEIDLLNPDNYHLISPNLFRVQKFGSLLSGFWFRHHLETKIDTDKSLKGITYKVIQSTKNLEPIVKVRVNHIGQIVTVGEY
jgi:CRISPR-associated endonuclease Csn1